MTMCWLSEKTTGFAIYKHATEDRAKIRASPTGRGTVYGNRILARGLMVPRFRAVCPCSHVPSRPRHSGSFVDQRRTSLHTTKEIFNIRSPWGTVGPVRLSEVWPVGSMRPRFCCVDRREHQMPYRVRSMILGVLGLLLFGPASSAAQSGPTRSSAGRGQRAPHRSGHVARGSPAGTGGPAWGRAGGGAEWRAGRPGGSGGTPRINAERPSSSSVDTLDVPPNRWEKKAAAKRAPSGWQGRSVTRTTTS